MGPTCRTINLGGGSKIKREIPKCSPFTHKMSDPWAAIETDVVTIWEDVKWRLSVPFFH